MMRHELKISMVLLIICCGCVSTVEDDHFSGCNVVCGAGQACKNDICYDTCSLNKLCPGRNMACINNLCIAQDAACAPDTRRCSEDMRNVLICKDGLGYDLDRECPEDQTCDKGACVSNTCVEDTKRCRNNNVEICRNQSYMLYSECESPQQCSEVTYTCEIPPECSGDNKRCDESGNVQICDDGHWQSHKQCSAGQACDPEKFECVETAACAINTRKCMGDAAYVCSDSKWVLKETCGEGMLCEEGECVKALCQNGQMRCFEATNGVNYTQVCVDNAYESTECPQNHVCIMQGEDARCVLNECTSGNFTCNENALYKCEGNEYVLAEECGSSSTCSASKAACLPNCGNGNLDANEQCDGIYFKEGLTCASQMPNTAGDLKCTMECELDLSGCADTCESGTSSCDGQIYRYCEDEKWKSVTCEGEQKCGTTGCYTPSFTGDWDYLQGFESLEKIDTTYTTDNSFTDGGGQWVIIARTNAVDNEADYRIDGAVSIVFKGEKSSSLTITNIPKDIKTFAFSWQGWGGNNDKGTLNILVDDKVVDKVEFTKANTSVENKSIELNKSVQSIQLKMGTKKDGRIVIDNVRWKY